MHTHPQRNLPKPIEAIVKKEEDYKQLNSIQKFFFWIGILSFLGAVGIVCYAFLNEQKPLFEKLIDIISFLLTGVLGLIFSALQVFPNMLKHIRDLMHVSIGIRTFTLLTNILILCFLIVSTSLSITTLTHITLPSEKVVEIGVSLPLSGGDQGNGQSILKGVQIAINEQGNIRGYKISLVSYDDQSNPNNVGDLKKFVDDHPQLAAIVGPFNSGVAAIEIPQTSALSIPLISPANTADCLTIAAAKTKDCDPGKLGAADNATYFRLATVDSVRTRKFAEYLSTLYHTVAIFRDTTVFGDSFAAGFSASWQKINGNSSVILDKSTINADDIATALRELKTIPDIVLFAGTGQSGLLLLNNMQQLPGFSKTAFASAASIMIDSFESYLKNPQSGPAYAIAPVADANCTTQGQAFITQYNIQSGIPTPYTAGGYDATKIVLAAIDATLREGISPPADPSDTTQVTSFRQAIDKNIKSLNKKNGIQYDGVTGNYIFNDQGDVIDTNGTQPDGKVSIYKFDRTSPNWQRASGC